jgi:F-type H+-transporting ATPase subunit alpha
VSRVGGNAQTKAMKKVAGRLRLDLAQFRELAAFAQFASDLDKATQDQLARGQRTLEVLKQGEYEPVPVEKQVAIIYAVSRGLLDSIPVERIRAYEAAFHAYMDDKGSDVLHAIRQSGKLEEDTEQALKAAIEQFNGIFSQE